MADTIQQLLESENLRKVSVHMQLFTSKCLRLWHASCLYLGIIAKPPSLPEGLGYTESSIIAKRSYDALESEEIA